MARMIAMLALTVVNMLLVVIDLDQQSRARDLAGRLIKAEKELVNLRAGLPACKGGAI